MKICILMGSPRRDGNTAELARPFADELQMCGAEVETVALADREIEPCLGCYACQDHTGEYGCIQKDDMQKIVDAVVRADCFVLAAPIYIWYCPSQMKAMLDRFYGMNKYYGKGTGSLWEGKQCAILATHGYDAQYGAGPFETGIRRFCEHAKLRYRGMYSVRDLDDKASFQTPEAIAGARAFARALLEDKPAEPADCPEEKTALLVIDMQTAIMQDHPLEGETAVQNINRLLSVCRQAGIEAIFVRHNDGPGTDLEFGSEGWQIWKEIVPRPEEHIFEKRFNSALKETGLKEYLEEQGIRKLILTGMQTEYCIDATCKAAFEAGYRLVIPEGAVTTCDGPKFSAGDLNDFYLHTIWSGRFAEVADMGTVLKMVAAKPQPAPIPAK
jgi:nicotinamidase-related amidase/putative NADPH-quinone reductase